MAGRRCSIILLAPLCAFPQQMNQMTPTSQYPASLLSGLHWRDVGPMRGGRTYAVAGHRRPARHLLFRLRGRRRLEDRERRPHLVSHLR